MAMVKHMLLTLRTIVSSDLIKVKVFFKIIISIICHVVQGAVNATTVAGGLTLGSGYSELYNPSAIFVDANGTLYILDSRNYRVQKWLYGEPLGFTVAGGYGTGTTTDKISLSYGLFVDRQSNIYISDTGNHRVVLWQAGNTTRGRVVNNFECGGGE